MNIKLKNINKIFLVLCVLFVSALSANAYNSLSAVDVKQTGNNNYDITLKTDNSIKVKKISENKDSLTLILSSVLPSESIDIAYDNTSDLKNVIVQKKNASNTIIVLQGKNIENAKIYAKELSTGTLKPINPKSSKIKYLYFIGATFALLFYLALITKRKHTKRKNMAQTLKDKVNLQGRYIPSINYTITKSNVSVPKELIISQIQAYREQKIKKAG